LQIEDSRLKIEGNVTRYASSAPHCPLTIQPQASLADLQS